MKPESGGVILARDLIRLKRKANWVINPMWWSRELVQYIWALNELWCKWICKRIKLNMYHNFKKFTTQIWSDNCDTISVCGELCCTQDWHYGDEGLRSGEYLLIQSSTGPLIECSCLPVTGRTTQSASDGGVQVSVRVHIPVFLHRKHQPSYIWSTNTVPLCHSYLRWRWYYMEVSKVMETARGEQQKRTWKERERERKETALRTEGVTCSKAWLLKGKASLCWRAGR